MIHIMKKYTNDLIVNGVRYTHIIEADSYKEALLELKKRKQRCAAGKQIKGRLTKVYE